MNYGIESDIEGYVALAVSIFGNCSPDEAFNRLDGKIRKKRKNNKWDEGMLDEIERMRDEQDMTWKEIAEVFELNISSAYRAYMYHRRNK